MPIDLCCADPAADVPETVSDLTRAFVRRLNDAGWSARASDDACAFALFDTGSAPVTGPAPLTPDTAMKILEAAGLVAEAADETAVRFCFQPAVKQSAEATWASEVAGVVVDLLSAAQTAYDWLTPVKRAAKARVPFAALDVAAARVRVLEARIGAAAPAADGAILVRGPGAALALDRVAAQPIALLPAGGTANASMHDADGRKIDDVVVACLSREAETACFAILSGEGNFARTRLWIDAVLSGAALLAAGDALAEVGGALEVLTDDVSAAGDAALAKRSGPTPAPDLTKPFFIGQAALAKNASTEALPEYRREAPAEELRRTVLYETHKSLGAKMVPFAGWEMPVQYPTGIFAEHRATRTAAALFDVTHMSVFDIQGPAAAAFLDAALAGRVADLPVGRAAYNYLLNEHGVALDDTYVYHVAPERYLLVVNAANTGPDWDWLVAVNERRWRIDPNAPGKRIPATAELRDLRFAGDDALLDLAFQGPRSREVLMRVADSDDDRRRLEKLPRNGVESFGLAGARVFISRTGYTGEIIAFEIFVHPDKAVALWNTLLDAGRGLGVLPAGLGARDAARMEAGLPLFGHELEGELGGTLAENGYPWVTKLSCPWFVGRAGYLARIGDEPPRKIVRLAGQGAKSARPGHRILGDDGRAAGVISSFAYLDEQKNFVALAFVDRAFDDTPGRTVHAARIKDDPKPGDRLDDRIVPLTVLRRFPDKAEREEWRKRYAG
ncbi:MAG: hypothetical protein M5R36_27885 [Deltaproteobacteria bacterium]|nr:hypothetical protein [Deltaproteobacteria bacterium]